MKKTDLQTLTEKVRGAEAAMAALEKGEFSAEQAVQKALHSIGEFRAQASSLGSKGLAQMGKMLEKFGSAPSPGAEHLTTLSYALGVLRKGMEEANAEGLRAAMVECLEVLGVEALEFPVPHASDSPDKAKSRREKSWSATAVEPEAPASESAAVQRTPAATRSPVVSRTAPAAAENTSPAAPPKPVATPSEVETTRRLLGKIIATQGPDEQTARIEMPRESLEKMEYLLCPFDAENPLTQQLSADDELLKDVLKEVKTFVTSFVDGDLHEAQSALETIANLQGDAGLFNEIGAMARSLHSSIKDLSHTLNPELMDRVEAELPDSENRLGRVLELTENAANTVVDHVEAIRKRMAADQEKLRQLEQHFSRLKPMGEGARRRMNDNSRLVRELRGSLDQVEADLAVILTSQGHLDLTGQIITKIVASKRDLEAKLVKLVSTLGGKVRRDPSRKRDELSGPAHPRTDGGVRSQDEVDALLAELGF